ncbi:MAG: segregation/condensation protein A [Bacilli bacterium]|nr:segregation/condensation protein A [Bacilli bacterium]
MDYKIRINQFEGPMDLLLHLIKKSDIDIIEINIEQITNQYLEYIMAMKNLNLDIASEYLTMAAELIEIKSSLLLPNKEINEDEYEEDPKENLIKRLIEYKKYKEITNNFKELEEERKQIYTKLPSNLDDYKDQNKIVNFGEVDINALLEAFNKFLERKKEEKPIHTKITKKEYSVSARCKEIRNILKTKKKMNFEDLFEVITKDYVVVTFLSILDLAKKGELEIQQEDNFDKIVLSLKGSE